MFQLDSVSWQLNLQMAQSSQASLKSPSAVLQLGLTSEDSEVRTHIVLRVYDFFLQPPCIFFFLPVFMSNEKQLQSVPLSLLMVVNPSGVCVDPEVNVHLADGVWSNCSVKTSDKGPCYLKPRGALALTRETLC